MSSNRDARKQARRAAQAQKVAAKGEAEAEWFWQCVAAAAGRRGGSRGGKGGNRNAANEAELFGKQLTQGINFDQYDTIPVSRSCDVGVKVVEKIPDLADFYALDGDERVPRFLFNNVQRMGYAKPTPIQRHSIPICLDGRADLMCCAQTGSGKTCAFLLPAIACIAQSVSPPQPPAPPLAGHGGKGRGGKGKGGETTSQYFTPARPRVLVLAPTRELAIQIELEAKKLTFASNLRPVVVYGGAPARGQLQELADGVDVLVATPGRLTDFLDRALVSLAWCEFLILDEADRMLDMGFEPQLRRIVERSDLSSNQRPVTSKGVPRRTLMFSATFPAEIQRLAGKYLRPYAYVAVGRVGSTTASIEQRLVWVSSSSCHKRAKMELLVPVLRDTRPSGDMDGDATANVHTGCPIGRTIVFVQKKHVANWVRRELQKHWNIPAEEIHGDRSQAQREAALARFKDGKCIVLVATDVAARGLDIPNVNHVVNFDLPPSKEEFDSYVHRIGRTGRAGNVGLATSLYVDGFESKTGNGPLWESLYRMLVEGSHHVPPWFTTLKESRNDIVAQLKGGDGGNVDRSVKRDGRKGNKAQQPQSDARGIHGTTVNSGGGKNKTPGVLSQPPPEAAAEMRDGADAARNNTAGGRKSKAKGKGKGSHEEKGLSATKNPLAAPPLQGHENSNIHGKGGGKGGRGGKGRRKRGSGGGGGKGRGGGRN